MIRAELSWQALWQASEAAGVAIETFLPAPPIDLDDARLTRLAIGAGRRELLALADHDPDLLDGLIAALGRFASPRAARVDGRDGTTVVRVSVAESTVVVEVDDDHVCTVTELALDTFDAVQLGSHERVPELVAGGAASVAVPLDAGIGAHDGRLVLDGGRSLGRIDVRAVADTPSGEAIVRLDTAHFGVVHLVAPHVGGRLCVASETGPVGGLGTVASAHLGDGTITLTGSFGELVVPATSRVVAIDRWRGDPDDGAASAVIAAVLDAPEVQVSVSRGDGVAGAHVLSCRGEHGVDQSAGAPTAVFLAQDLVLRTLDLAGLLTCPTSVDPAPAAPTPGRRVDVQIARVAGDGALVGGTASWVELGASAHVVRLDGADGEQDAQHVEQLVGELLDHFGISEVLR